MIPAIVLGCYVAGLVIAARIYVMTSDEDDRSEARFNATLVGLLWPIVLVFVAALGLLALPTLGAKTGQERRQARLAAERGEAERRARLAVRTAELEAENERLRKAMGQP